MNVLIDTVDGLLESQSLFDIEIHPQKDLDWTTRLSFQSCELGSVFYSYNRLDASAYLSSENYHLVLPIDTHGQSYALNGDLCAKMFILSPMDSLQVVFPKVFSEIHVIFEANKFIEMAKKNQAYELIETNRIHIFNEHDLSVWGDAFKQFLEFENQSSTRFMEKIIDCFFTIYANSSTQEYGQLEKSFYIKEVMPYLKDNLFEDLAVTDMCDYFKVSRRSFELSFKKFFQDSPAAYFKKMKLMAIYSEIKLSKAGQLSMILAKYNGLNVAHFGQYYKGFFHETMTDTLKKSYKN